MGESYLGEIFLAGFNFAPKGFALCNGQLLPISQNAALFALLGSVSVLTPSIRRLITIQTVVRCSQLSLQYMLPGPAISKRFSQDTFLQKSEPASLLLGT